MDHSIPCDSSIRLIEKLKSLDLGHQLDFIQINQAISWAKKYHDGQFRKSGEPYYTHPLAVAYMVSDYLLKTDAIVASILHDIVEDTEVTAGMILDAFGQRIEQMVDRLTRDRPDGSKLSVEAILSNAFRAQDKEVILIKLIDRLHNMQTLSAMTHAKQREIGRETLEYFISICFNLERKDIIQLFLDQINIATSSNLKYNKTNPINYKSRLSLDFQNELIQKYSQ